MSEPWREQVMLAIVERLQTIVAGSVTYGALTVEYQTTPSLVSRALQGIAQYDQPLAPPDPQTQLDIGPVLGVMRSSGSTFSRIQHVPDSGGAILGFAHELRLRVWAYCKPTMSDIVGTILERVWWDHMQAILVEPRFGGLVSDTMPDGVLDTDDGVIEPLGYFYQDWLVMG